MHKNLELKDQTEVLIREMTSDDLDQSVAFFAALSEEEVRRVAQQDPSSEVRAACEAAHRKLSGGAAQPP